jgi:hypothetical protein
MNLRFYISLIIIVLIALNCKQENTTNKSNSPNISKTADVKASSLDQMTAKELETLGYKNYNGDHKLAIDAFKKAASIYDKNNEHKSAAVIYTNISNLYRDAIKDKNLAVDYALMALTHWRKEKDVLQQGNLLKDIGLLQAETYQIRESYRTLNEAIVKFRYLKNNDGIAITEHNIAMAHYLAEDYIVAEKNLLSSKEHWKSKNNIAKIFNNNILAIDIYRDSNQLDKLQSIIEECENMRTHNNINRYADQRYVEALNKK